MKLIGGNHQDVKYKAADSEETTTKVAESFEGKLNFSAVIFTLKLLYYKIWFI